MMKRNQRIRRDWFNSRESEKFLGSDYSLGLEIWGRIWQEDRNSREIFLPERKPCAWSRVVQISKGPFNTCLLENRLHCGSRFSKWLVRISTKQVLATKLQTNTWISSHAAQWKCNKSAPGFVCQAEVDKLKTAAWTSNAHCSGWGWRLSTRGHTLALVIY